MEGVFDLTDELVCDTFLAVKMTMYSGRPGFVHYAIPVTRKDGSTRQFGDLYNYFTKKEGFRFAIGYVLGEDGKYWTAKNQYFFFSKRKLPHWSIKESEKKLLLPKYRK